MRKKSLAFRLAALLAGGFCSHIAEVSSSASQAETAFVVDVWGEKEGLPQSSVIALTQTRDGYLWLGTLNGLVRFDGVRFTVFDESNTPGLNSSRIVFLFEDSARNLWIGTENSGAAVVTKGRVKGLDLGRGGRARRLVSACEDAEGAVWLYTADGQLARHFQGRVNVWGFGADHSSSCRQIIAEASGPVCVGLDWGVYGLGAPSAEEPRKLRLHFVQPLPRLDFLLASRSGGYWRLANGQVQKWRTNRLERDLGAYPWGNAPVTSACEDAEGNLVVGTLGAGVYWFGSDGHAATISQAQGLSHDGVLSLCLDREGSLWVGTDGGGLNRVKRKVFEFVPASKGWVVQSVCADSRGGLWLGFNDNQATYWDGNQAHDYRLAEELKPNVRAMFVDHSQSVWAGTLGVGLLQLRTNRFEPVSGAQAIAQNIYAIHQDRSGRLWLGTHSGLVQWNAPQPRVFTMREGLSANVVRAIADDREGTLWIGTEAGGLNRFQEGKFTAYRKEENGLPSDHVSSLFLDDEGVLWIGTDGGGLARFHEGRWTRYTTRDGLISNSVGYLLEDGQGYLWMGSYTGLMRIEKKALNDFARGLTNAIPVRAYGKADGLPTGECTLGSQPGAWRTRDGRLWFPTVKGLVSVNPAELKPNPYPPPVMIESVLIEGQEQNTNSLRAAPLRSVTLPPGKERLEIHYTSLNLAAPDRARFKYRMEGHETEWTEAGDSRVVRYSKLPPGNYRFQVTACNEDGVWNETGAALAVVVEPPFWRTWWFLTLTALFLLAAVVAIVHTLSTQKLRHQLERMRHQEALEKERSRIARDLHDQLGANLTQVALLSELVETDNKSPDEVEAHARQISQTARETTRALDEIVWAANPSNDTLEGLITYACKYAQEYLVVAGLRYRLDVPPHLPGATIPPEVRHNVFLAFKEAVNNVVKHAHASETRIRLRLDSNAFTLEIEDNGRGLAGVDEKSVQTRNGLRNMRKRMEDIHGEFFAGPATGGGTVVRLTAPIGQT